MIKIERKLNRKQKTTEKIKLNQELVYWKKINRIYEISSKTNGGTKSHYLEFKMLCYYRFYIDSIDPRHYIVYREYWWWAELRTALCQQIRNSIWEVTDQHLSVSVIWFEVRISSLKENPRLTKRQTLRIPLKNKWAASSSKNSQGVQRSMQMKERPPEESQTDTIPEQLWAEVSTIACRWGLAHFAQW